MRHGTHHPGPFPLRDGISMFSVVVPVFNHEAYLPAAVQSALRSRLVSEVLLVDDGSEDESRREIARLAAQHPGRVRDLTGGSEGNLGAHHRLNQLVEEVREDWVAVLNSDDAFVSGRFELLSRRLRRSEAQFAFGHLVIMDARGRPVGTKRGVYQPEYPFPRGFGEAARAGRGKITELLANQNFIATTSNLVFKRRLAQDIGGFSDLRYVHDWDFAIRAAVRAKGLYLPHFLSLYRDHGDNTIKASPDAVRREVRAMFRAFGRDFPEAAEGSGFREALAGNEYLEREST